MAIGVGLLAFLILLPTTVEYISPGHVGIVIHRPAGGRRSVPLGAGLAPEESADDGDRWSTRCSCRRSCSRKSPTEGSRYNDEINVNSVEGQPLSLDVSMCFELDPAKAPQLYTTFRTDIRDPARLCEAGDPSGPAGGRRATRRSPTSSAEEGRGDAQHAVDVVESGYRSMAFIVKQFTINELRAPPAVIEAINQKNVMQQQALTAQNELQKNTFQAQGDSIKAAGHAKAILAEAEAQAKANALLAPEHHADLVQYEMAKRWNGQMPQVSGSAMPMIQLPMAGNHKGVSTELCVVAHWVREYRFVRRCPPRA